MIVFTLDKLLADRKMQSIELARILNCTPHTVSRIKTGKVRALRIETLDALCEYFGCKPGDILDYVDDEEALARFGEAYVREYKEYFKNRGQSD